jgi:predicted aldo/keto reductase-like oxidoreductase
MNTSQNELRKTSAMNRRGFLQAGAAAFAVSAISGKTNATAVEWRNQQTGMAYRRLGRAGMMISEVICGGDPIKLDNYQHLNLALEMGLNYLDMAPSYNQGQSEEACGYLEEAIRQATAKGMGLIAMKAAHAVATHHKALQPIPEWRVQKIHRIVPGEMKAPMKAYLWALQNPNIAAVISNLWDETFIKENLSLAGRKVALQPA